MESALVHPLPGPQLQGGGVNWCEEREKDLDLTDSISLVLKFAGKLSTNFFVHGPYLKLVTRS